MGGTGLLVMNELRSRAHRHLGLDQENLGRWTWARIEGRAGHWLRVVAAYRPVIN